MNMRYATLVRLYASATLLFGYYACSYDFEERKDTVQMDAIQMIRDDHRRVQTLFRDFEEAPDVQTKKAIFDNIYMELEVHTDIEEEIFYPSVQRQGQRETVRHAEEEHGLVKQLLNEMVKMDPKDPSFESKFHV